MCSLGSQWHCLAVTIHCDNSTAVAAINSGYGQVTQLMHLLQCLLFIRDTFSLQIMLYTLGQLNSIEDAISCNKLPSFSLWFLQHHTSKKCPTRPPQPSNRTTNRLDITDLDKVVQQLFSASITHSTHCSYQSVAHRYLQFCHFYNITSPYLVFVVHLFSEKLSRHNQSYKA